VKEAAQIEPKLCCSIGWCIVDAPSHITIASTLGVEMFEQGVREEPQGHNFLTVPRGMVVRVMEIDDGRD
jgi:hypothetical protein